MSAGGALDRARGALARTIAASTKRSRSLLLTYIAIALLNHLVEGPMRDPASLNKPSTRAIGAANMLGNIPGIDVHWGLVFGVIACGRCPTPDAITRPSASPRGMAGGNIRAAQIVGLPGRRS